MRDIIESTYRHDFRFCKCGAVEVDDGKTYLRRLGYEELSKVEKNNYFQNLALYQF